MSHYRFCFTKHLIFFSALLSAQPPVAQVGEAKTSPWLVMGLSLMSLMVILIILLGIVAWKWKQKRIEERRNENEERQFDSSTIERGVMNPTFVGTSVSGLYFWTNKI